MQYYITPTLIDNIDFMINAPFSWAEKAYNSVLDTLTRKWSPMSPEIQRGVNVEKKICSALHLEKKEFMDVLSDMSPCVSEFWDACNGGLQQAVVKKELQIGARDVLLYGKADIYFPGKKLIDIKTTRNYKGEDKYLNKSQHVLYMVATDVYAFEYLVCVFDGIDSETKFRVEKIDAGMSPESARAKLSLHVTKALSALEDDKTLWKAYTEIFNVKK